MFLAFLDNDRGEFNQQSIPICLYHNAWHRVNFDSKEGRPYLGIPQPNVYYYNEDIKLPEESNIDSEDEAPTYKPQSDPPSKDEV
jgi:hypothetical protein